MLTITLHYPNRIPIRRFWTIGLIAILLIISFILIGVAIFTLVKSTPIDPIQADPIHVVQNSITPIAVPIATPSIAELQPIPSETPVPTSAVVNEPSIIAVAVPTPPSL